MWLSPLTVKPANAQAVAKRLADEYYNYGHAHISLIKTADNVITKSYSLYGRLVLSKSGWLLLEIPNALVRGIFDAINEPGIELPLRDGKLTAHVSAFRPEELEIIGGP